LSNEPNLLRPVGGLPKHGCELRKLRLRGVVAAKPGSCRYLTDLDIAVANGALAKSKYWDPLLETLRERGAKHEKDYVDHLRHSGYAVAVIEGIGIEPVLVDKTIAAMKSGWQIIVQGAFMANGWGGRTDILRRVDTTPSELGAWSYEVIDTKLARETKGGTVLQLCVYSDLVASVQGCSASIWVRSSHLDCRAAQRPHA
jgi:hypothetical protein